MCTIGKIVLLTVCVWILKDARFLALEFESLRQRGKMVHLENVSIFKYFGVEDVELRATYL